MFDETFLDNLCAVYLMNFTRQTTKRSNTILP